MTGSEPGLLALPSDLPGREYGPALLLPPNPTMPGANPVPVTVAPEL